MNNFPLIFAVSGNNQKYYLFKAKRRHTFIEYICGNYINAFNIKPFILDQPYITVSNINTEFTNCITLFFAKQYQTEELFTRWKIAGKVVIPSKEMCIPLVVFEYQFVNIVPSFFSFDNELSLRTPQPNNLPQHIINIVINKAERDKAICPITLDEITSTNSTITSCGHIFNKYALHTWLKKNKICPECRTENISTTN
jgi:hypothetical protein